MTEITTLRHDDPEAALPHQVELPADWELPLVDPLPFTVDMPGWVPLDSDSLVALHWWACLLTHLQALLPYVQDSHAIHYRLEKVNREAVQTIRGIYGTTVSAALAVAGHKARPDVLPAETQNRQLQELSYWSMAIQCVFGLQCVRAAAKGRLDPIVEDLGRLREWTQTAFVDRCGADGAALALLQKFTGTSRLTVEEKMEQWRASLEAAAEGLPEGVDGVAEAVQPEAKP